MIMGMSDVELQDFVERISATAIANQAIIKCQLSGVPLTVDNVILFVGDFCDPSDERFVGMIEKLQTAIEEVIGMPWRSKGDGHLKQ